MKINKLLKTLVLVGLTGILAGCGGDVVSTTSEDTTSIYVPTKEDFKFDSFNYTSNFRDLNVYGEGSRTTPHTEITKDIDVGLPTQTTISKFVVQEVKVFVVPVEFTDYTADKMPLGREGTKNDIYNAVFGDGSGTYHESLSSFYSKSSHGQCKISGVVTEWFNPGVSSKSISIKNTGYAGKLAGLIYDYYTTGEGAGTYDMSEYDANKDGLIDSLVMIYTPPYTTTGEIWWAFRTSTNTGMPSSGIPTFYDFFWCSYRFFYEGYSDNQIKSGEFKPDSHTLIHEFGHVLSLPDYYVTDYAKGDYSGTGGLDMMDMNIGDHNSVSKAWYGWVEPYVIDQDFTIEINSTTDTGEFVIVPLAGNEFTTLLDQYIVIEFLTPTGVAVKDGQQKLNGSYPLYYSVPGVRIMLCDARLGMRKYTGSGDNASWKFTGFTTRMGNGNGYYVTTACSNTASSSIFPKYKLLEVIPATGKAISTYSDANDSCLYREGQIFGETVWKDYKAHGIKGDFDVPFGYTISIDKINGNESATISIKKI